MENLDLQNIDISSIPNKIENLQKLKYLNIADIEYKTLPLTLGNLKKLEYLRYAGIYATEEREFIDEEVKMIKELKERGVEVLAY